MKQPKYETELEVTQALIKKEITGIEAMGLYKEAIVWQKHLKSLQPPFYRRANPNKKIDWLNNVPGYTMTGKEKK
jgi:hypothetical protein